MWFRRQQVTPTGQRKDFPYLGEQEYYFDSACQTLRPQIVLDAMMEYYTQYNACGGRVKYAWGRKVDDTVERIREEVVRFVGKNPKEYTAAFTLNTTYGINLLVQQLPQEHITTAFSLPWEHNSVLVPMHVLQKERNGMMDFAYLGTDTTRTCVMDDELDFIGRPLVCMQATSNIDGQSISNLKTIGESVRKRDGYFFLDAAQAVGHNRRILKDVDFDACVFSAHKMYGPSLGVIVIKKSLIPQLIPRFVGGGTVTDVHIGGGRNAEPSLERVEFMKNENILEPGLQDWAGIIGLGAAMDFLEKQKDLYEREMKLGTMLYDGLRTLPGVVMYNQFPSSTITFHTEKCDSHRLAMYLSEKNIMVRSGYFCCHSYLKNERVLPPLLRFSLGAHNTASEVDYALTTLQSLLTHL